MKFFVRTFGCKVNLADSLRVVSSLLRDGHEQVNSEEEAELVVVNSCAVTSEADRKCRSFGRSVWRDGKRVVVIGCGPRIAREEWGECGAGIDVLFSDLEVATRFGIVDGAGSFCTISGVPVRAGRVRGRGTVVIQRGCDDICAYCAARIARGPHVSVSLSDVLSQVDDHVAAGCVEVVLAGINLAAWGCETTLDPSGSQLSLLLEAILEKTQVARVRLSSLGPQYLSSQFFRVFGDDRVCDHLHLSVQSGSDSVLKAMRRGHSTREVERVVSEARKIRSGVAISADFIVGFPGETDRDFNETLDLVMRVGFAQLHVFPFSPRRGTPAFEMLDQVPSEVKRQRVSRLIEIGRNQRADYIRSQCGSKLKAVALPDGTAITSNGIRLKHRAAVGGVVFDVVPSACELA